MDTVDASANREVRKDDSPANTSRWTVLWRDWIRPLLVILLIVGSVRSAVADWNYVPTGSMKPTILEGDRIFVNKLAYDLKVPFTTWRLAEWSNPARGDVVVLFSPADDTRYVKRVIGLPGDRVELRDNELFLNGQPVPHNDLDGAAVAEIAAEQQPQHWFLTEELDRGPHTVMLTPDRISARSFGPVVVPAGHFFVMGDNRDNSLDSRWFGFVSRDRIVGQALAVVMSMDPNKTLRPRWRRFFTGLP